MRPVKCLDRAVQIALLLLASQVAAQTNLVDNGDFTAGATGFESAYSLGACSLAGRYQVLATPASCHSAWTGVDHTSGSGNLMAVNGHTTAGVEVWASRHPVCAQSDYVWTVWVASMHSSTPALLSFRVNDVEVGTKSAPSSTNTWDSFTVTWNSGTHTLVRLAIVDLETAFGGNDFGLDDISFVGADCPVVGVARMPWTYIKQLYME